MLWILGVTALVALLWAAWAFYDARQNGPLKTSQVATIGLAVLVMTFGVGGGSIPIATAASQQDAVNGYHQFLNGSIVDANVTHYVCERDGDCRHTYDCDPYTVSQVVMDYDSKGNVSGSHIESHTEYHSCPYVTDEFSYSLIDSIAFKGRDRTHEPDEWQHIFSAQPRKWHGDGDDIPSDVHKGVPALWKKAKDALSRGDSIPITVESTYANYILASEQTILKAYSNKIDLLRAKRLLPEHTQSLQNPIVNIVDANKMSFIGFTPSNASAWQSELMQFNAALGSTKQGDLHVVAIKASSIPASVSPEDYLNALKAYWLNGLDKYALAKNGIALVLGVDDSGSTIQWSRASTGMPIGNGAMLQALGSRFAGQPFSVETVFGHTMAKVLSLGDKPKMQYTPGTGVVPTIVLQEFPFERACMNCESDEDKGKTGFVSLSSELPLDGTHTFWAIFLDLVICGILIWLLNFICVTLWNLSESSSGSSARGGQGYYGLPNASRTSMYPLNTTPLKRTKGKKSHV